MKNWPWTKVLGIIAGAACTAILSLAPEHTALYNAALALAPLLAAQGIGSRGLIRKDDGTPIVGKG